MLNKFNRLEAEQDIANYKKWMSEKSKRYLIAIRRKIEIDETYRPGRWYNVQRRLELLDEEINAR